MAEFHEKYRNLDQRLYSDIDVEEAIKEFNGVLNRFGEKLEFESKEHTNFFVSQALPSLVDALFSRPDLPEKLAPMVNTLLNDVLSICIRVLNQGKIHIELLQLIHILFTQSESNFYSKNGTSSEYDSMRDVFFDSNENANETKPEFARLWNGEWRTSVFLVMNINRFAQIGGFDCLVELLSGDDVSPSAIIEILSILSNVRDYFNKSYGQSLLQRFKDAIFSCILKYNSDFLEVENVLRQMSVLRPQEAEMAKFRLNFAQQLAKSTDKGTKMEGISRIVTILDEMEMGKRHKKSPDLSLLCQDVIKFRDAETLSRSATIFHAMAIDERLSNDILSSLAELSVERKNMVLREACVVLVVDHLLPILSEHQVNVLWKVVSEARMDDEQVKLIELFTMGLFSREDQLLSLSNIDFDESYGINLLWTSITTANSLESDTLEQIYTTLVRLLMSGSITPKFRKNFIGKAVNVAAVGHPFSFYAVRILSVLLSEKLMRLKGKELTKIANEFSIIDILLRDVVKLKISTHEMTLDHILKHSESVISCLESILSRTSLELTKEQFQMLWEYTVVMAKTESERNVVLDWLQTTNHDEGDVALSKEASVELFSRCLPSMIDSMSPKAFDVFQTYFLYVNHGREYTGIDAIWTIYLNATDEVVSESALQFLRSIASNISDLRTTLPEWVEREDEVIPDLGQCCIAILLTCGHKITLNDDEIWRSRFKKAVDMLFIVASRDEKIEVHSRISTEFESKLSPPTIVLSSEPEPGRKVWNLYISVKDGGPEFEHSMEDTETVGKLRSIIIHRSCGHFGIPQSDTNKIRVELKVGEEVLEEDEMKLCDSVVKPDSMIVAKLVTEKESSGANSKSILSLSARQKTIEKGISTDQHSVAALASNMISLGIASVPMIGSQAIVKASRAIGLSRLSEVERILNLSVSSGQIDKLLSLLRTVEAEGHAQLFQTLWRLVLSLPFSRLEAKNIVDAEWERLQWPKEQSFLLSLYRIRGIDCLAEYGRLTENQEIKRFFVNFAKQSTIISMWNFCVSQIRQIEELSTIEADHMFVSIRVVGFLLNQCKDKVDIPSDSLLLALRTVLNISMNMSTDVIISAMQGLFQIAQNVDIFALFMKGGTNYSLGQFLREGLLDACESQFREAFAVQVFELCTTEDSSNVVVDALSRLLLLGTTAVKYCDRCLPLCRLIARLVSKCTNGVILRVLLFHAVERIRSCTRRESSESKSDPIFISLFDIITTLARSNSVSSSEIGKHGGIDAIFTLLFDTTNGKVPPPSCKNAQSREDGLDCLISLSINCEENEDRLNQLIISTISLLDSFFLWNFDPSSIGAPSCGLVGLKNQGCTCYMNSLLQQLFMVPEFRQGLMKIEPSSLDADSELVQLQHVFANLSESQKIFYDPLSFCLSYKDFDGNRINLRQQQDANEFYNILFDRLENQSQNKANNPMREVFGGTMAHEIIGQGDCMHVSARTEPFFALSIDVMGKKNLEDSLDGFIQGEMLDGDNKYNCSKCNKKVNAIKQVTLGRLPPVFFVHLKRFDFDFVTMRNRKVNSRFEFEFEVDFSRWTKEENKKVNDYYKYDLQGILMHSGTATSGHYYSYIKERDCWYEFNDKTVRSFDPKDIPSASFGGDTMSGRGEKHYSAYMLVYRRRLPLKTGEYSQGKKGWIGALFLAKMSTLSRQSNEDIDLFENETEKQEEEEEVRTKPVSATTNNVAPHVQKIVAQIRAENATTLSKKLLFSQQYREFLWKFIHSAKMNDNLLQLEVKLITDIIARSNVAITVLEGWLLHLFSTIETRIEKLPHLLSEMTSEVILNCPLSAVLNSFIDFVLKSLKVKSLVEMEGTVQFLSRLVNYIDPNDDSNVHRYENVCQLLQKIHDISADFSSLLLNVDLFKILSTYCIAVLTGKASGARTVNDLEAVLLLLDHVLNRVQEFNDEDKNSLQSPQFVESLSSTNIAVCIDERARLLVSLSSLGVNVSSVLFAMLEKCGIRSEFDVCLNLLISVSISTGQFENTTMKNLLELLDSRIEQDSNYGKLLFSALARLAGKHTELYDWIIANKSNVSEILAKGGLKLK